jgi:hypothetical protein
MTRRVNTDSSIPYEQRPRLVHGGVFYEDAVTANGITRARTYRSGGEKYLGNMLVNSPSGLEQPYFCKPWPTEQNPIVSSRVPK